jgi:hypothetical protein
MNQGDYIEHLTAIQKFIDDKKKENIEQLFNGRIVLDDIQNPILKENITIVLKNINTILYAYGKIQSFFDNPTSTNADVFMNNVFYLYDILYSILQEISLYLNNILHYHVYQAMYNNQYQNYYDLKKLYPQQGGVRKKNIMKLNITIIETLFEFMKTLNFILHDQSQELKNKHRTELLDYIINIINYFINIEIYINVYSNNIYFILIKKPEFRLSYIKGYIIGEVSKRIELDKKTHDVGNKLKEYTRSKLDQMMKEAFDKSVEDAKINYPVEDAKINYPVEPKQNVSLELDDIKLNSFRIKEEKIKGIKLKLSTKPLIIKGLSNKRSSISLNHTHINKFLSDHNIKKGDVISYCKYFLKQDNKNFSTQSSRQRHQNANSL